jgi:ADP-ribose pyrophosphatase
MTSTRHHDPPPDVPGGLIARRPVYDGRIVRLSVDEVRFPDGSRGELELVRHAGASCVLPFLDHPSEHDPRVMLVRQYRYASDGYLYEVPAGMPDREGEPWEECARRELEEETGFVAGSLRYLTRIYTTPGFSDEVIRLYGAWDLSEGRVHRDQDEFMEVHELRFSRTLDMVRLGEIVDCKSVATILFADRFLVGGAFTPG